MPPLLLEQILFGRINLEIKLVRVVKLLLYQVVMLYTRRGLHYVEMQGIGVGLRAVLKEMM